MIQRLACVVSLLWLSSCATGTASRGSLDFPLVDIQNAVESAYPGGVSHISSNGREFFSRPFRTKSESTKDRLKASAIVLGDRRPYDLKVQVRREKKESDGSWTDVEGDETSANKLLKTIVDRLYRTQDKNIIDHFKAF